jgi:hypothetical protein
VGNQQATTSTFDPTPLFTYTGKHSKYIYLLVHFADTTTTSLCVGSVSISVAVPKAGKGQSKAKEGEGLSAPKQKKHTSRKKDQVKVHRTEAHQDEGQGGPKSPPPTQVKLNEG